MVFEQSGTGSEAGGFPGENVDLYICPQSCFQVLFQDEGVSFLAEQKISLFKNRLK